MQAFAADRGAGDVDLLLFPECFLQGYLVEPGHLGTYAIDLQSAAFGNVLRRLAHIRPVLVFGVIERAGTAFFNTAVVVREGSMLSVYRKTHLTAGERLFVRGTAYDTFNVKGISCGINICYDTNFSAAAKSVASRGADVLLVPAQNMMKRDAADEWRERHNAVRAERVRETGMWLVSADVTGERDASRIACGPTCIMNPAAEVVAQVPLMTVGMVTALVGKRLSSLAESR